jgi:hypothetical protein
MRMPDFQQGHTTEIEDAGWRQEKRSTSSTYCACQTTGSHGSPVVLGM